MDRTSATRHPGRSATAARPAARLTVALVALVLTLCTVGPTWAGDSAASPSPAPPLAADVAWPSVDGLRRDLQDIGFVFRVDPATGDWRGWAPPAPDADAPPALTIGGLAGEAAWAAVQLDLLQTETQAAALEAALTGFWEVATRLAVPAPDAAAIRAFISDQLLGRAPESLASCALRAFPGGVLVVRLDREQGTADLLLATDPGARDPEASAADCIPILAPDAPEPGEVVSVRLAVGTAPGEAGAFEPAELEVEGELVTIVLTFTNDSAVDQSLTFRAPLTADTGRVAPGATRLIVLRRLEPGAYAFNSISGPETMTGRLQVTAPGDG